MCENNNYQKLWKEFGKRKAKSYLGYKFKPTHRIGLTNYLREELIYKFLNCKKNDIILDAGCAAGRQLFKIANQIKKGYGIDISESFIKQANEYRKQNNISNLLFKQVTLELLPFADNFFDKIICAEVLEHVKDKNIVLKKLLRVLKKNGILIITVPNLDLDGTLWGRILRFLGFRKFNPLINFSEEAFKQHGNAHVREFNKHTISELLQRHNLEIITIKSVSFIDGPFFDFLLKFPLHVKPLRIMIICVEKLFTKSNLPLGRHLIIKLRKK